MVKLGNMEAKYDKLMTEFKRQVKVNEKLQEGLVPIKMQLNKKEQIELKNNVIIHGVPFKRNEVLSDVVNRIGAKLNMDTKGNFSVNRIGNDENRSAIKVVFKINDTKLANNYKIKGEV